MKLKKIKLNTLANANMLSEEMNALKGGERACSCSCYWENKSGPSSSDNAGANYGLGSSGGYSQHGCNQYSYSYSWGMVSIM